jgi:hypothetical protein
MSGNGRSGVGMRRVLLLVMFVGVMFANVLTAQAASSPPSEMVSGPAEATSSGVVLKGKLNPGGPPTTSYFEYSANTCDESTSCIKQTAPTGPLTGDTQQEVQSVEVTGLIPGTVYSYRLVATNQDGTEDGPELMFTAPRECPLCDAIQEPKSGPFVLLVTPLPATAPVPVIKPILVPERLTNAQKLERALRTCRRKPTKRRAICGRQARSRYTRAKKGKR